MGHAGADQRESKNTALRILGSRFAITCSFSRPDLRLEGCIQAAPWLGLLVTKGKHGRSAVSDGPPAQGSARFLFALWILHWETAQGYATTANMNDAPRKVLPRLDESLLKYLPLFAALEARQIRDILDLATSRRYLAGTPVFEEGMPAERFYMLLDGYIRVARMSATGDQVTLHYIPSGEMFGIARAFRLERYPATAMAAVDSIGLSWPMVLWDGFVANYEGFAHETFRTVGGRLSEKNDRIVELTSQQVQQRIANALLRMINQTGRKVEGGILIDFPVTRRDISEMTATTEHTVSRLLSKWQKEGILESKRRRIKVLHAHRLTEIANPKS